MFVVCFNFAKTDVSFFFYYCAIISCMNDYDGINNKNIKEKFFHFFYILLRMNRNKKINNKTTYIYRYVFNIRYLLMYNIYLITS